MIIIAALVAVLCSTYVSGACSSGASSTVVLPYQQIGSDGLNDTIIETVIQNHLAKNCLRLAPEYAAVHASRLQSSGPLATTGSKEYQMLLGSSARWSQCF